jgi:hypothetical protein
MTEKIELGDGLSLWRSPSYGKGNAPRFWDGVHLEKGDRLFHVRGGGSVSENAGQIHFLHFTIRRGENQIKLPRRGVETQFSVYDAITLDPEDHVYRIYISINIGLDIPQYMEIQTIKERALIINKGANNPERSFNVEVPRDEWHILGLYGRANAKIEEIGVLASKLVL